MLLSATGALLLLSCLVSGESSIRIRANLPVFQFFSKTGHHVVDEEIPKIKIPPVTIPIDGGPGKGSVSAQNMKIVKFKSPRFDFQLQKEGLSWVSREGAIKIEGDWTAEYTVLVPLSESGWMTAFLSDIRVSLTAGIFPLDGRPQVRISACKADITQLEIEIGGGVLPWLVNLFKAPISAAIKEQIHKQACTSAKEILLEEANDFLHALPVHIPLGSDFWVDYIFDRKTQITRNYVEADVSADVVYGNVSCLPKRTGNWTDEGDHPGMVTGWLSQSIPNCLLSSAHRGGLVQFTVTKDLAAIRNYLQTSCSFLSVCIGRFFPKLKKDYPNKFVDLHFHTYESPLLLMSYGFARLNTTFAVEVQINPRSEHPDILARLLLTSSSQVIPYINGTRLMGSTNGTISDVREDFSKIGNVSSAFLKVFDEVFSLTANVLVQSVLHKGIPLPIYDNITISNSSRIDIFNEYVRLNVDFEYK